MRLSAQEIEIIRTAILSRDSSSKIFIFGSRTQDTLKGGDIDLLVLSNQLQFSDRIDILVELKMKLGDQKIDLLIRKNASTQNDPFVAEILKSAIAL